MRLGRFFHIRLLALLPVWYYRADCREFGEPAMSAVRFTLGFVAFAAACSPAAAATLTATVSKENKTIVSVIGEITTGDSDKLKEIIRSANESGRLVSGIRFNSPGGILLEGVKLADLIRYAKTATVVANGNTCASACFIAFAAGSQKFVSYTATVGVHGASDKFGQESGDATVSMARIVKELGVPEGIIGKMVVARPDEIVWLNPDDLRSMGTTMTGKPAQIPPGGTAASQPPMQLAPSSKAIAPQTSAPKTWADVVKTAATMSSRQNNGQPRIGRQCQPNLKVCTMAVFFKGNDGKEMMAKETEDVNGKPLAHELCEFNDYMDVRTCVDWEGGSVHRDMKDGSGEWHKVADE
jgi:hypothetical protein